MGFDSRHDYALAASATFLALGCVVVPLRFYSRFIRNAGLGVDDWLNIPALLMVIGCAISFIVGLQLRVLGYPTPPPANPQDPYSSRSYNFTITEKTEWAFFLMQVLSMGFIKLSFIFFFRRIFVKGNMRSRFRIVSWIAVAIVIVWTTWLFLWFLFSCGTDFGARWDTVKTLHAECSSDLPSDFALSISDFLTDGMIMILPIPMILRLQMSWDRKLAVLGVFALGALTLVASLVRLVLCTIIIRVLKGQVKNQASDEDLEVTRAMYWSMVESGLALIACNLAPLTSLVRSRASISKTQSPRNLSWAGLRQAQGSASSGQSAAASMIQVLRIPASKDRTPPSINSYPGSQIRSLGHNSDVSVPDSEESPDRRQVVSRHEAHEREINMV